MSGSDAPRHLAPAYQLALDLEADGLSPTELAERLGLPVVSIPALLKVAHAKAARAACVDDGDPERTP